MEGRAHVVVASDKFKGTATSAQIGTAMATAARASGWRATVLAVSDGGEGLLDVYRGANRTTEVTGPLGDPVPAGWRLEDGEAVVECARASGLTLAGGPERNRPLEATSAGTGELIEAAVGAGASRVVVGLGGSACTDGGLGAVRALGPRTIDALTGGRVELIVCCDVDTRYEDAGVVFGPQKGATPAQVVELTERLRAGRRELESRFGVDVQSLAGSGAAGGLAGGLAAVGGQMRRGFDLVAARLRLAEVISSADLVLTGEGRLDAGSFEGKVVGGVTALARAAGVPVAAVVGDTERGVDAPFRIVSLVERFGRSQALGSTLECVERATRELLP